jgi:hypothetical protein
MLQQHPILLPTSTIHSFQRSLPNDITMLWAKDLDMIGPVMSQACEL